VLIRLGYVFRKSQVGEYVVIDHIRPESAPGPQISVKPSQIRVTSRDEWAGRMVDGDRSTRWGSGMPQKPGMAVDVLFENETAIAAVELDHGRYLTDLPRHLVVTARLGDGSWCELVDFAGLEPEDLLEETEFDNTPHTLRMHFAPRVVRAIHLEERDPGKGPFDWSIAELRVFSPLAE
jgi:hypothetical protein